MDAFEKLVELCAVEGAQLKMYRQDGKTKLLYSQPVGKTGSRNVTAIGDTLEIAIICLSFQWDNSVLSVKDIFNKPNL